MSTTHSHILPLPKAVLGLKIAQLVIAVVVLGLAAYGVTFVAFDGDSLMLFTALVTMIITVYYIVAVTALTSAYNYWAILGLDIFAIVFWIISMSLLAWEVAAFSWAVSDYSGYSSCGYDAYGYYTCDKKRDINLTKRATTDVYTYRNALAAAAGLGGLEFILFIVTLVMTAIHLHRHRKAGGHCTPGALHTAPVTHEQKGVELQGGAQPQQQQYYQAPPQEYQAPPQHDQQVASA